MKVGYRGSGDEILSVDRLFNGTKRLFIYSSSHNFMTDSAHRHTLFAISPFLILLGEINEE